MHSILGVFVYQIARTNELFVNAMLFRFNVVYKEILHTGLCDVFKNARPMLPCYNDGFSNIM